jgi:serine/threonine-protein kinase
LREGAAFGEEEELANRELGTTEQTAKEKLAAADRAEAAGTATRAIYEGAGAAAAMVEAKKQWLKTRRDKRLQRESLAQDLRRQIEELRGQLSRYAEALEEDLASGREKVAARAREALKYEKKYLDATQMLVDQLKGKPECRDLLNELISPPSNVTQESGNVPNRAVSGA